MFARPQRNLALSVVLLVAALAWGRHLSDGQQWLMSGLGFALLVTTIALGRPWFRARELMRKKDWERAATAMAGCEQQLTTVAWRRTLAALYVGFYSSDGVAVARNNLGAIRLEQDRLDDAKRHFERALERDPGYAMPWANLAVIAARRHDRAESERCRDRARALGFHRRGFDALLTDLLAAPLTP
jgi:tetratricopeptide (TPR) repeat protein